MMEPTAPARARIAAAAILLDRGWGKAKEMHEHSGPDSKPITKIVREIVHVTKTPEEMAAEGEEPLLIEWRGVRGCGDVARCFRARTGATRTPNPQR
jgi:hypothetical protein